MLFNLFCTLIYGDYLRKSDVVRIIWNKFVYFHKHIIKVKIDKHNTVIECICRLEILLFSRFTNGYGA